MTRILTLALVLGASTVHATTLLAMDINALSRASDVIVRGTVVTVEARLTADKSRIMTDALVRVAQVMKGAGDLQSVMVMQPGGEVGEVGQHVEGTAKFSVGEEVVLFLEKRGQRYLVAGMSQGKLRVERSPDGKLAQVRGGENQDALYLDAQTHQATTPPQVVMSLDELTKQVRAALDPSTTTPIPPGAMPTRVQKTGHP